MPAAAAARIIPTIRSAAIVKNHLMIPNGRRVPSIISVTPKFASSKEPIVFPSSTTTRQAGNQYQSGLYNGLGLALVGNGRRKNRWVDLQALFGNDAPEETRLYYSQATQRAAVFNSDIIPFNKNFPCQHGDKRGEFFVADTAPHRASPGQPGEICRTAAYLDSLRVPFFVLPSGVFKHPHVGDTAIGWITIDGIERLVFGIVGDSSPPDQIGEGSIAFLQQLRGTTNVIKNALETGDLDIKLEPPTDVTSLSALVLGGTADALGLDYSPENIDKVAHAALARWNEEKPNRLRACNSMVHENPLHGVAKPTEPH